MSLNIFPAEFVVSISSFIDFFLQLVESPSTGPLREYQFQPLPHWLHFEDPVILSIFIYCQYRCMCLFCVFIVHDGVGIDLLETILCM